MYSLEQAASLRTPAGVSPRSLPLRDVSRNVPQRRWARRNVCRSQANNKQHFGTRWMSCVAYRPAFYTPYCSHSHKGLAPREITSREIWERFQLIDISTVWQPKSNYLKRAKSGRKRVVKEMITGSLSFPFPFPAPPTFRVPFSSVSSPTIWEPATG